MVSEERAKLVPPPKPTQSEPPASSGPLIVSGKGWRATVPAVAIAAVASALGARMLPTPTPTDDSIRRMETKAELQQLRDEQWRNDVRRELEAIRERVERTDNELRNRLQALEARIRERRTEQP